MPDAILIKFGLLEISGTGALGIGAVVFVVAALLAARYFRPRS